MKVEGLAAIVAASGPFHGIEGPPEMSDSPTEEELAAYDEWWVRTHTWRYVAQARKA